MTVVRYINFAGKFLSALLLLFITVMMIIQICLRYIFDAPLDWAEESCTLAFIAMIFIGSISAEHIRIGTLVDRLKTNVNKYIQLFNLFIQSFYFGFIGYLFLKFYSLAKTTNTNVLEIPLYFLFALVPISFLLICIKEWLQFFQYK